jgi:hypothetical protein
MPTSSASVIRLYRGLQLSGSGVDLGQHPKPLVATIKRWGEIYLHSCTRNRQVHCPGHKRCRSSDLRRAQRENSLPSIERCCESLLRLTGFVPFACNVAQQAYDPWVWTLLCRRSCCRFCSSGTECEVRWRPPRLSPRTPDWVPDSVWIPPLPIFNVWQMIHNRSPDPSLPPYKAIC